MKSKRFLGSTVAIVSLLASIPFTTVGAAGIQADDEVTVEPSEDNPLVLLADPSEGSEEAATLTESSTLVISEVGDEYQEVTYTDDVSGEEISGYALTEDLETYLSDSAATEVVVAPSEEEPLELFIDGELEKAVYLTEETTLVNKESEGHFTTVEYTDPKTDETEEALVESKALAAAATEESAVEETTGTVEIPEGEALSFYDEASEEGDLVFDLLVESELTIGEATQYIKVAYTDAETNNEVEGYVLYSDLASVTDDIDEVEEAVNRATGVTPNPLVLDVSHWQVPSSMDYDKLAKQVDLVIIRIQDGTSTEDRHYKTHIQEFQKRGVPVHVYAFMRASSTAAAKEEATLFYNRAKQFDPTMYWVDVEVVTASNMSSITSAYVNQLNDLVGDAKVGAYIAHNLYSTFNINTSELDGVWIPRYGLNDGYYNSNYNPNYTCDIHQYTEKGRLNGYSGDLDLSRLTNTNNKDLTYFTSKNNNNINNNNSSYYTTNPGKVRLTSTENIYSSVEFNDSTKTGKTLSVGSIVTVTGIEYSKAGTPRLKVSGGYITANMKYSTTDTTTYYSSNPGKVRLTSKESIYNSVEFTNSTKTGNTLPIGSIVAVTGIAYSKAGTPRLKVSGGYITANKSYSTTDTTAYYISNPGTVRLTSTEDIYSSVEFTNSTKTGKSLSVGSIVAITGIGYSKAGTPRLKVSGGYITANKKYSTTDTTTYYSSNPGKVRLTSTENIYSSGEFNDSTKTGKTLSVGSIVTVTGIAYSKAGTPRLKVSGGYITANKKYSTTDTTTYYSSNPGKVQLTSKENIYSSTEFNNSTKTGKTLSKGSTVTVTGIAYSKAGTPRLKVSGGYITANKKYSKQS